MITMLPVKSSPLHPKVPTLDIAQPLPHSTMEFLRLRNLRQRNVAVPWATSVAAWCLGSGSSRSGDGDDGDGNNRRGNSDARGRMT